MADRPDPSGEPVPRITTLVPTPTTRFLRAFLPWQLVRFVVINLRMLGMIRRAHPHRVDEAQRP